MVAVASKYRYRGSLGVTRRSLDQVKKHLHKIGKPISVRGYWYLGRYGKTAAVLVRGEHGTCRFGGFSWGYGGEGPRGTLALLETLGVDKAKAQAVIDNTPWDEVVGPHWRLDL